MLNRRAFLRAAGVVALVPSACVTQRGSGVWVNDIHSQLNRTLVSGIEEPRSIEELQAIVRRSGRRPVAIAGGRHAMGGQQFASNAALVDIRKMNRVLSFDRANGIVEVESGIQWPELIAHLVEVQRGDAKPWGIAQKQTGADRLTLGGTLAANAHGRGLRMKPIAGDVESFVLVDAVGNAVECSRTKNDDLFRLAIGGYGLFGVIGSIRLRLVPRRKVERIVEEQKLETLSAAFERRIADGFLYGDFQFSIDDKADNFLRSGVFSCYRPVSDDTPIPGRQQELSGDDWMRLLYLAHADKQRAYQLYVGYYLGTTGQVYWSDEHQLSFYADDYHRLVEAQTKTPRGSEIITELYVPRPRLAEFMDAAAEALRRERANVVYGTVRLIEKDDETFLPWARERFACVIFNLHTEHAPEDLARVAVAFRALIDAAIARGGSYFLTYHRYARRDQVEACYPQFAEFLRLKRQFDPRERFQSDWYRHQKALFA